ncbi:hypothetical protein LXL04_006586 [Taraxacum kok-saghyz]
MMRRKRTNEYRAGPGPDILPVSDTKALEALITEWVTATVVLYDNQRPDGSDPWDSMGVAGETPDHAHTNISCTANPNFFFGNGGFVELTRWLEKTESVFQISSGVPDDLGKYATCAFANTALSWKGDPSRQEGRAMHMGLAPQIRGMVTASRPVTFGSTKSVAVRSTNPRIRHGSMAQKADSLLGENNKRKSWEISHNKDEGSDRRNTTIAT